MLWALWTALEGSDVPPTSRGLGLDWVGCRWPDRDQKQQGVECCGRGFAGGDWDGMNEWWDGGSHSWLWRVRNCMFGGLRH